MTDHSAPISRGRAMAAGSWAPRVLLCLCLAGGTAGCSKKMLINRYPEFYSPEIRTVAVLLLVNETRDARASRIVTDRLVEALKANGTYKILGPSQVSAILAQANIQTRPTTGPAAPGADPLPGDYSQRVARALGSLGVAQGVLIGRVEEFDATSSYRRVLQAEPSYYPYYPFFPYYGMGFYHGHRHRSYGYYGYGPYYPSFYYREYNVGYNEGTVSAAVSLLKAADGSLIYAMPAPARVTLSSEGDSPDLTPAGCLQQAARLVARRIVDDLAVVPQEIKIKPKDALRTASGREGNKWRYTDTFQADNKEGFVVVELPPACDRNTFSLKIAADHGGKDQVLATKDLTWSKQEPWVGVPFSPKELFAGAGPGGYRVRLYRGEEFVMDHDFNIR